MKSKDAIIVAGSNLKADKDEIKFANVSAKKIL